MSKNVYAAIWTVLEITSLKRPPAYGGGGGSVFFVTDSDHKYLKETELREEAGTPAIVESIRAGLVMKLKKSVQPDEIMKREHELLRRASERLAGIDILHKRAKFCLGYFWGAAGQNF